MFDMKWKSVRHRIWIENYWNKRLQPPNERLLNVEWQEDWEWQIDSNQECIQFNECDFTISTNNHNIVRHFIRRSCFVAIPLPFYARFSQFYIHSTAQTMTAHNVRAGVVGALLVLSVGWLLRFCDNATKTIEIGIRLYCSGCHFNASNRSKMSVQNILITFISVQWTRWNGHMGKWANGRMCERTKKQEIWNSNL